jgi:hypothetical protein
MSSAPRQRRKGSPWRHRPHHRAFYALSKAAQTLAVTGFRANETNAAIIDGLLAQHSATIAESSLNRYREWWEQTERPFLEASERADELVRSLTQHPTEDLERLIKQLLTAQRLTAMTEDKKPDPVKLGMLDIEERRLALEGRKVALRERELERRVAAAAGKVEGVLKKRGALDDEAKDAIRAIYGLAPKPASVGA